MSHCAARGPPQAVYGPQAADGLPAPIWDKATGQIDAAVAEHWREHFDLSWILRRDWNSGLGENSAGRDCH